MAPRYGNAGRYVSNSVGTASRPTLLVMLYDRALLDIDRAILAIDAGVKDEAHNNLVHAQEIVMVLLGALDRTIWDGADGLAAIYSYVRGLLQRANISGDASAAREARSLLAPLCEAWRTALSQTMAQQAS